MRKDGKDGRGRKPKKTDSRYVQNKKTQTLPQTGRNRVCHRPLQGRPSMRKKPLQGSHYSIKIMLAATAFNFKRAMKLFVSYLGIFRIFLTNCLSVSYIICTFT